LFEDQDGQVEQMDREEALNINFLIEIFKDHTISIHSVYPPYVRFITTKCIKYLKSLYDPAIEFLFYIRRAYDSDIQNENGGVQWNRFNSSTLQNMVMSMDIDRKHIADIIELSPNIVEQHKTTLLEDKVMWLKEHILDETTPTQWIQDFLKAVTGSSYLHGDSTIIVEAVLFNKNSYCTSHTCMNQLDVSPEYNDLPGISDDQLVLMDPKTIFIQNISNGLVAHSNHMTLA